MHDELAGDVPRLIERLDRPDPGLVLTSRRHLRSNNSWLHNVPTLSKGAERCTRLMHLDDASAAGATPGALVTVRTTEGEVAVAVEVSDEMMAGVVSLPHGWAHDRDGTRLAVASARPGVNSNLLNPGDLLEVPSGAVAVNGVPCAVEATSLVECRGER